LIFDKRKVENNVIDYDYQSIVPTLLYVVVVVVNFISGLLNNINNKESNSKPERTQ